MNDQAQNSLTAGRKSFHYCGISVKDILKLVIAALLIWSALSGGGML